MVEPGIHFQDVWKKFQRVDRVNSLRDLIPALMSRGVRGPDDLHATEFWAIRDVSFEVKPGQCLGVIGPNGAGKSTVLKLLSRILRPNRGKAELRGRVGSLIEISAGFHQDLTGRENVFLQGAIMGMKRQEIRDRFDEIVEFSGISKFIDSPVRRYSSGMNARLGFSIAAHLDAEVLIIDEVLSVGDMVFQQRAFDRIKQMISNNVAGVVVSHQLDRISTLCDRALLLSQGRVVFEGDPATTIAAYVAHGGEAIDTETGGVPLAIEQLLLLDGAIVRPGGTVTLQLTGRVLLPDRVHDTGGVGIHLRSLQTGQQLFATSTARMGLELPEDGLFDIDITLDMNVEPGLYGIETSVYDKKQGRAIATGPRVTVQVDVDYSFVGRTFARPSMHLAARAEARPPVTSVR